MQNYFHVIKQFRRFAKQRMQPEEAIATARKLIKERVAARETSFLNLVKKAFLRIRAAPI